MAVLEIIEHGLPSVVFLAVTTALFLQMCKIQTEPYMDEIFHIPQAQNYCNGHYYHWNDKITTLPGLYLASQLFLKIYSIINNKRLQDSCDSFLLRCTNFLFIFGCYNVLQSIIKIIKNYGEKHANDENSKNTTEKEPSYAKIHITALVITSFPLLYFYTFLYYTDTGSTFLVLLGYYLSLRHCHVLSAITGIFAVVFRQTNIIWVGFNAACSVIQCLKKHQVFDSSRNLFQDVYQAVRGCIMHLKDIVMIAFPYGLVFIGFLIFVLKNNGIVVGDRSSHEASLNLPQLLYFSAFVMFFSCFVLTRYFNFKKNLIEKIDDIITSWKKLLFCFSVVCIMFIAVHKFTYIHKYLISDNRHYTFYIWRKVFDRHWTMKYLLVPGYFIAWLVIVNELSEKCSSLWILLYIVCTAVVLVPQKLLEFRYFVVPYIIFRLHIRMQTYLELFIEVCMYFAVNTATLYLFMYHPFFWSHDEAVQRFMW